MHTKNPKKLTVFLYFGTSTDSRTHEDLLAEMFTTPSARDFPSVLLLIVLASGLTRNDEVAYSVFIL